VDYVLYEPEPDTGILWIKLNRPERMNALLGVGGPDGSVYKLTEYMKAGDADPNIRVMVVTGVGRAFCAGIDIRRGGGDGEQATEERQAPSSDASRQNFYHVTTPNFVEISRMIRKPVIAMVNGPAVGMGMDIALHCDVRIGSENTLFRHYYTVGQIIENGGTYWLPRIMGIGRALEFAFTGELNADEAYRTGVLNHLVPHEKLEEETRALAIKMTKISPTTQWINKRNMRASLEMTLDNVMVLTSNASGILGQTEDAREARQALAERRDPVFKGR
ncbi:MAG TPA: enoyl-CoA hydratase-related protein, partial [Thermoleophilia bacterium]|nr:enoyl-CoA hydratase-related protein [Thermoleophilia bacterium]